MKYIYIVLSQSGSVVSAIIQKRTKKQYNHCSIAFDSSLTTLYSMGRLYPNNPLIGRLVIETPNVGTYKKFKNTTCKVLKVPVSKQSYDLMHYEIMRLLLSNIRYDYTGLILGAAGIPPKSESSYMCSTLLKHILTIGQIDTSFFSTVPHPSDFEQMDNYTVVFEGLFNQMNLVKWNTEHYNF